MVDLATIKADLPDWPDQVIELWLLKLANRGADMGWPPPNPFGTSDWQYILADKPLSWWKQVTWKLLRRPRSRFSGRSHKNSRSIVNKMLDAHVNGKENIYSNDANSKDRFVSAAQYIAENATVPQPLVGFDLADGLSVLDGNHRMTGLCYCQAKKEELLRGGLEGPASKSENLDRNARAW